LPPAASPSFPDDDDDDDNGDGPSTPSTENRSRNKKRFKEMKRRNEWMVHQNIAVTAEEKHRCCYSGCPGKNRNIKEPQPFWATHICEECSMDNECNDGKKDGRLWFCNEVKRIDGNKVAVNCHRAYHKLKFSKKVQKKNVSEVASPIPSMPKEPAHERRKQKRKEAAAETAVAAAIEPTKKKRSKVYTRAEWKDLPPRVQPSTREDPDGDHLRPSTTSSHNEGKRG
jgi:hypothetical protein